jgi:hypothetical protein
MRKAFLILGLMFPITACAYIPTLLRTTNSTPLPFPTRTTNPTLTPKPSPSSTSEPTETSSPIPSATSQQFLSPTTTLDTRLPSPIPTLQRELDCKLIWQSPPRRGAKYKSGVAFTTGWKVRNVGSSAWDANSVEFTYVGGAKLHDYYLVNLDANVAPKQSVILSVHMRAPKRSATTYTTVWSLRQGDTFFCRLTVSIYVE